jgi:hypothetical protein
VPSYAGRCARSSVLTSRHARRPLRQRGARTPPQPSARCPRVVVIEDSAHQLPSSVQARAGSSRWVKHSHVRVDTYPAECEGDVACDREPVEGRLVRRLRSVRYGWVNTFGVLVILDRRVECDNSRPAPKRCPPWRSRKRPRWGPLSVTYWRVTAHPPGNGPEEGPVAPRVGLNLRPLGAPENDAHRVDDHSDGVFQHAIRDMVQLQTDRRRGERSKTCVRDVLSTRKG